ncbi:hypothetical protein SDJN02_11581, partial [Cucurbita argyrosperma subsp. argyrosperma]
NPQSTNGRSSELFIQFSSPQPSHHVKIESCSPPSAGDGRHRGGGGCGGDDPVAHVEELRRRKQGLETKINSITHDQQKQVRKDKEAPWMGCSSCAVNWLRENEALLQLTSNDTFKLKFSQILHSLDEEELLAKPNTPSRVLQEILNRKF